MCLSVKLSPSSPHAGRYKRCKRGSCLVLQVDPSTTVSLGNGTRKLNKAVPDLRTEVTKQLWEKNLWQHSKSGSLHKIRWRAVIRERKSVSRLYGTEFGMFTKIITCLAKNNDYFFLKHSRPHTSKWVLSFKVISKATTLHPLTLPLLKIFLKLPWVRGWATEWNVSL